MTSAAAPTESSQESPAAEPIFLLLRIPKTGGMSLTAVLHGMFGRRRVYSIGRLRVLEARSVGLFPWKEKGFFQRCDVVNGHLPYLHPMIQAVRGRTPVYVSVMRDPVDRAVSYYDDIRRRPQHHLHEVLKGLSLKEAFLSCEAYRNHVTLGQLRYVFGTTEMDGVRAALRDRRYLIGRSDALDHFIGALKEVSGRHSDLSEAPRVNVGSQKGSQLEPARDQEDFGEALALLREANLIETDFLARIDPVLISPLLARESGVAPRGKLDL